MFGMIIAPNNMDNCTIINHRRYKYNQYPAYNVSSRNYNDRESSLLHIYQSEIINIPNTGGLR